MIVNNNGGIRRGEAYLARLIPSSRLSAQIIEKRDRANNEAEIEKPSAIRMEAQRKLAVR